jgi:hypothetical protein
MTKVLCCRRKKKVGGGGKMNIALEIWYKTFFFYRILCRTRTTKMCSGFLFQRSEVVVFGPKPPKIWFQSIKKSKQTTFCDQIGWSVPGPHDKKCSQ